MQTRFAWRKTCDFFLAVDICDLEINCKLKCKVSVNCTLSPSWRLESRFSGRHWWSKLKRQIGNIHTHLLCSQMTKLKYTLCSSVKLEILTHSKAISWKYQYMCVLSLCHIASCSHLHPRTMSLQSGQTNWYSLHFSAWVLLRKICPAAFCDTLWFITADSKNSKNMLCNHDF